MSGEDPEYLAWIRRLPCCMCGRIGASNAHHETHGRGLGQREHDHRAIPLCWVCHAAFHTASGAFREMSHDDRTEWQAERVKECLEVFFCDGVF